MKRMASLRTFLAIEVPEAGRSVLRSVQDQLKTSRADVRWEATEKMHATLKFLGNVDEVRLPTIVGRLEKITAKHPSFRLTITSLGCFPNVQRPRVIWAGCADEDGTLELVKTAIDVDLLTEGFEIEEKHFHPHVTLGRVRSPVGLTQLTSLLKTVTFVPISFNTSDIVLMRSVLKPGGSEYSVLHSLHLAE